ICPLQSSDPNSPPAIRRFELPLAITLLPSVTMICLCPLIAYGSMGYISMEFADSKTTAGMLSFTVNFTLHNQLTCSLSLEMSNFYYYAIVLILRRSCLQF
ncbi:hypothetical protein LINPERPRIM_LOCUS19661, partial [Linum perenne]